MIQQRHVNNVAYTVLSKVTSHSSPLCMLLTQVECMALSLDVLPFMSQIVKRLCGKPFCNVFEWGLFLTTYAPFGGKVCKIYCNVNT